MDSTRFSRDDELYTSVLHNLANNCAGLTSAYGMDLAVAAAMHTVYSAIADFCAAWNTRSASLLPVLPNELLVACFEKLQSRDRRNAARVSRGWRGLLLATPTFWTKIARPAQLPDNLAVLRLQNMLERSGSAQIDVLWHVDSVSESADTYSRRTMIDLLKRSMSRIRSLGIQDGDVDALLNAPAPFLETLTIWCSRATAIPAQWIRDNAPILKSLTMREFFLPPEPLPLLPSIVEFRGEIPSHDAPGAQTLFQLFPNLRSLNLRNLYSAGQLPERAPSTLNRIVLRTYRDVDFDRVLSTWVHYPQHVARSFDIMSAGPVDLRAAVQHLSTMQPSSTANISIKCDVGALDLSTPAQYNIHWPLNLAHSRSRSRIYDSWAGLAGSPSSVAAICRLTLTDTMLIPVLRGDLDFLGLAELALRVRADYWMSHLRLAVTRGPLVLRAPHLRLLSVDIHDIAPVRSEERDHTAANLAEFVATCIQHGSGKLESITIAQTTPPSWEHVSGLLAHSEKIYYCTTLSGDEREEMGPPQERQEPPEVWDEDILNALAALSICL